MKSFLGFDYGSKRIGVAIGDSITCSARPLRTLAEDWPAIRALIAEWRPAALVVGLPLTEDGGEQKITPRARRFAQALAQHSGLPVYTCDERYSTLAAESELRAQAGRRGSRPPLDAVAASIILEQWLQQNASTAQTSTG